MSAAFLAVLPGVAHAASLPHYDVEAHCKEVANFGGSYSASLDNACLTQEQTAYDALKAKWSDVPAEAQAHCDEVARFGGHGSYKLLEACIEQEMRARGERPKFQY
jgi:hypothetical protein